MAPELCQLTALEQHALVCRREISCVELLDAHLQWIERANPLVNALCTLAPQSAHRTASDLDRRLAAGESPGALAGLPAGIKDLVDTAGIRTTYGSPLFADHVPAADALHVSRMKAAGAVIVGKTNTPEWGAGSQTFNTLFGATATPWNLELTAGGSSGGAAAALAARMLPVADGSDLGGSLRNPAAFCNVVGFRPSPGRVPAPERLFGWDPLPVLGPMGRTVADVARLLSVMAGADPRDPLSLQTDPAAFEGALDSNPRGLRIAASEDLGFLPVVEPVREAFRSAITVFEVLGCVVEEAAPDLSEAPTVFDTLRAHTFAARFGTFYAEAREQLKDTVQWNTARGLTLSGEAVGEARAAHTRIYRRMLEFFATFDFLILPTTQVLPFPKAEEWVREIDGVRMSDYLEWMSICSAITLTGAPVAAMPCGFSDDGLPVGLSIVGPPGADLAVLKLARSFEVAAPYAARVPELPVG